MNRIFRLTLIAVALLSTTSLTAQDGAVTSDRKPMVTLSAGVKTFYPERMGIPGSASLLEALQASPEMLISGKSNLVDEYSLAVDGNGYLQDAYLFLIQTKVREVECIQLCLDSSASNKEPQVRGVINIVMKKKEKGFHGNVDLMADTRGDFSPDLTLSYGGDRWAVWTTAAGFHKKTMTDNLSTYEDFNRKSATSHTEINETARNYGETVKVGASYSAEKDNVTFSFSERFTPSSTQTVTVRNQFAPATVTNESKNIALVSSINYSHTFNQRLSLSASVSGSKTALPQVMTSASELARMEQKSTSGSGSAELKWIALKPLTFNLGANFVYGSDKVSHDDEYSDYRVLYNLCCTTISAKPYLKGTFRPNDKWLFQATCRLMFTHFIASNDQETDKIWEKDDFHIMSSAHATWTPDKHNGVMFGFNQILLTPACRQLYPTPLPYSVTTSSVYEGNEDLLAAKYNVLNLSYAFNGKWFSATVGTKYFHCADFIQEKYLQTIYIGGLAMAPIQVIKRYTWENAGLGDAVALSLSAMLQLGCFSLSTGFDYRHGTSSHYAGEGADFQHDTWSTRICPVIRLPLDFTASSTIMLIGREKTLNSLVNPSLWASACLSKKLGAFDLFLLWENIASHAVSFEKWDNDSHTYGTTDLHQNKLNFGVSWTF